MTRDELKTWLCEAMESPETIVIDDEWMDAGIVGYRLNPEGKVRLVYDIGKLAQAIVDKGDAEDMEEAREWVDENIVRSMPSIVSHRGRVGPILIEALPF